MTTTHDSVDQRLAYAESVGEHRCFYAGRPHLADGGDVIVADLGFRPGVQPQTGCVPLVIGGGHPFEVADHVVGFDTVNVVDLREIERVGDKRHGYESVNEATYGFPILSQRRIGIFFVSPSSNSGPDDLSLPNYWGAVQPENDAVETSDAADAADFVESFKASYGSPFFFADDIHTTGCPSGNDGTAIKDPSHAVTFGGSAIMASDSVSYNRSHVDAG